MLLDFNEAKSLRNTNTGNIGDDPDRVKRLSSGLSKRSTFSKAWEVGDQGTVYYPFRWWANPKSDDPKDGKFKILMAAYYGHKVSDFSVLGTTFLRSFSFIDEEGHVVGSGDLAYQFSRIAPLLVTASKEAALAALNKKDWSVLGQTAYQNARQKIEDEYDAKKNMKAKRALIGRLSVLKLTEVAYITMDTAKGAPIFDGPQSKTGNYIQTLSDDRLDKLTNLANDPNFGIMAQQPGLTPKDGEIYFLEVQYSFTSAQNSKADAGRNDPQGIAHSISLTSRFPKCADQVQEWLSRIPASGDSIAAHAYGLAPMPDEVLKVKLQTYMLDMVEDWVYLQPEEKSRLVKNASLLDYLRILPSNDPELLSSIEQELGHPIGQKPAESAPTLDKLLTDENGMPQFSNQTPNGEAVEPADDLSLDISEFGDIDGDPVEP